MDILKQFFASIISSSKLILVVVCMATGVYLILVGLVGNTIFQPVQSIPTDPFRLISITIGVIFLGITLYIGYKIIPSDQLSISDSENSDKQTKEKLQKEISKIVVDEIIKLNSTKKVVEAVDIYKKLSSTKVISLEDYDRLIAAIVDKK